MQRIKQEKVRPADDPDMPEFLQKYQETTMLTHSDVRSPSIPEGAGTAVIGGDFSRESGERDPMLDLGFIKNQEKLLQFDVFKDASTMRKPPRPDINLWDSANFSSIDNQLPIYPRKKGFVDFGKQTVRPEL